MTETKQEVFDDLITALSWQKFTQLKTIWESPTHVKAEMHTDPELMRVLNKYRARYAAASDETEAQRRCRFCHNVEEIAEPADGYMSKEQYEKEKAKHKYYDGAWCSIDENVMSYGHGGDGYDGGYNETVIHFCPICGRRLGGEGE